MKFTALLFLLVGSTAAFAPVSTQRRFGCSSSLGAAIELVAEPEGGEEMSAVKTMPGSRMKKMGEAEGLTGVREVSTDGENDDDTVYKYWMTAKVEGSLVKEIHSTVLRESAKKADFPGFRKGQVPPFAMPQIRGFAVEESIIQTVQSAIDAYGLKSVSGSDGQVEILEDVPEVARTYKVGDDLEFTAYFNAQVDPSAQPANEESSSEDGVVDVKAVAE